MHRIVWFLLVGACGPDLTANRTGGDDLPDEDTTAPVITHEPVAGPVAFGEDVAITATITDEGTGVLFAYLYYRNETDGSNDWDDLALIPNGETYSATISGSDHHSGGIVYYLYAVDKSENEAFAPDEADGDPYHFRLTE